VAVQGVHVFAGPGGVCGVSGGSGESCGSGDGVGGCMVGLHSVVMRGGWASDACACQGKEELRIEIRRIGIRECTSAGGEEVSVCSFTLAGGVGTRIRTRVRRIQRLMLLYQNICSLVKWVKAPQAESPEERCTVLAT